MLVQLPNNLFQVAQFGHHGHLLALRKEEKLDSNKTTRLLQCTCHDGLEASNKEAIATAFLHQGRLEGLFFRLLKAKKIRIQYEEKKGRAGNRRRARNDEERKTDNQYTGG